MAGLTIGKFAEAGGAGVETVRFYQRSGLLPRREHAEAIDVVKLNADENRSPP